MAVGDFVTYSGDATGTVATLLTPAGSTQYIILAHNSVSSLEWAVGSADHAGVAANFRRIVVNNSNPLKVRSQSGTIEYIISLYQVA